MKSKKQSRRLGPIHRVRLKLENFHYKHFSADAEMARFERRKKGISDRMFKSAAEKCGYGGITTDSVTVWSYPNLLDYTHALGDYHYDYDILRRLFRNRLRGKKIVHLGGNFGVFMLFLQEVKKARAMVVDPDKVAESVAKEFGLKNFLRATAQRTTLPNNSVDCLFAIGLLDRTYLRMGVTPKEIKKNFEDVFRESARVLKPGGFFCNSTS